MSTQKADNSPAVPFMSFSFEVEVMVDEIPAKYPLRNQQEYVIFGHEWQVIIGESEALGRATWGRVADRSEAAKEVRINMRFPNLKVALLKLGREGDGHDVEYKGVEFKVFEKRHKSPNPETEDGDLDKSSPESSSERQPTHGDGNGATPHAEVEDAK